MFLEPAVPPRKDNNKIIYRGLCLKGMGKVGKTFTCDVKVLLWLEQYAKKQKKAESHIVNAMLNSAKRADESWICPECDSSNANDFTDCHNCEYVLDFKDVKPVMIKAAGWNQ